MTPNIDIRIVSMIRSMEDVIIPSIDIENSLAMEQANLMINHLKLIKTHWARAADYATLCFDDLANVLNGLSPAGGALTLRAAENFLVLARESSSRAMPEERYRRLATAVEELLGAAQEDGAADFRDALSANVVHFSWRQARRDRIWFAECGFDAEASELPSIEKMLDGALL